RRSRWPARRPGHGGAGRRAWQVARIGVPAAVIVTVGAGALMMLTGRANDMLAERSTTSPAGTVSPGTVSPSTGSLTSMGLPGYPGEHGTAGVAGMWSAGGATVAVGYADGHPAVWRHAGDGTWSLVSAAALGGLPGHLTSVAEGPSGWIAVGSASNGGTGGPEVFSSADGVTWQPVGVLTGLAGSDARFLGVAAGPGGYLVVGQQGTGAQAFAQLWWSADLQSWTAEGNPGYPGSLAAAAVATGNGFVAVGSQASSQTVWVSADGQHWTVRDIARPSGAQTATLRSVAAASGRFVAAGYATGSSGARPIVVTSADGGAHITQVVLGAGGVPATVTAVTATSNGFVAVGQAGPAGAQHAVTWTSADGVTWSPATPLTSAGASVITALANTGTASTGTAVSATAQRGAIPAILAIPAP
ncbi:MAG TPA: hypothetical protein VHF26_00160, partial [Trebonia sp.]|nr:hypothetical protein [Trebonia sp.]